MNHEKGDVADLNQMLFLLLSTWAPPTPEIEQRIINKVKICGRLSNQRLIPLPKTEHKKLNRPKKKFKKR